MDNKTNISSIMITELIANGMNGSYEGVLHKKILPVLSVVQATEGSYDIALDNGEEFNTGEDGVFVAPANALQKITHHDGKNGVMRAHWLFIHAVVNDAYDFDELFSFPVILDKKYNESIRKAIETVRFSENYFEKMRSAYTVLEILFKEGTETSAPFSIKKQILQFVSKNYRENITAKDIANALHCSIPQVFRYTKKYYNLSPANYINKIRLQQADILLRNTEKNVTEIAFEVGFSDSSYFSRLFKKAYAVPPLVYRKQYK